MKKHVQCQYFYFSVKSCHYFESHKTTSTNVLQRYILMDEIQTVEIRKGCLKTISISTVSYIIRPQNVITLFK